MHFVKLSIWHGVAMLGNKIQQQQQKGGNNEIITNCKCVNGNHYNNNKTLSVIIEEVRVRMTVWGLKGNSSVRESVSGALGKLNN